MDIDLLIIHLIITISIAAPIWLMTFVLGRRSNKTIIKNRIHFSDKDLELDTLVSLATIIILLLVLSFNIFQKQSEGVSRTLHILVIVFVLIRTIKIMNKKV